MNNHKTIIRTVAAILLALFTFLTISSCGDNQSGNEIEKSGDLQVDIKDFYIYKEKYSRYSTLVVTYTFTNNSNSAEVFGYIFNAIVFQNGIALEEGYSGLLENANQYNAIKAGSTVDVAIPYELIDTTSDIEIEIYIIGTDKCILSKTLTLADTDQQIKRSLRSALFYIADVSSYSSRARKRSVTHQRPARATTV